MVDFFRTFKPILQININLRRKLLRIAERKRQIQFKKINHFEDTILSTKKVTGTFIYHTPPDYPGIKAYTWKKAQWIQEFTRLKEIGIDTVIHNGAVAETTTGNWFIFYDIPQSTLNELNAIKQRRKCSPQIIPTLKDIVQAAEETGMNLYLGLVNVLDQWYAGPSQSFIDETTKQELAVAKDLVERFGTSSAVKGWYISPEISHLVHGFWRKLNLRPFLQNICTYLKRQTPDKLIGVSPITNYNPLLVHYAVQFWIRILKNSGIDLFIPQDSVGVLNVTPKASTKIWAFWKNVAEKSGVHLWANCESFERASYDLPNPLVSASIDRFEWQLCAVSPFVEKIVTWEAMYFLNPEGAIGGRELLKGYQNLFRK